MLLPRSVRATGNVALSTVYYKDGAISQHYCAFNGKGKLVRHERSALSGGRRRRRRPPAPPLPDALETPRANPLRAAAAAAS